MKQNYYDKKFQTTTLKTYESNVNQKDLLTLVG